MDRVEAHRLFFAKLITANAGIAPGSEIEAALASIPREQFVGPPPWKIYTRSGSGASVSGPRGFAWG
jgi:protein-L-isoaspartate(D-aspartate) O-methyltransferase